MKELTYCPAYYTLADKNFAELLLNRAKPKNSTKVYAANDDGKVMHMSCFTKTKPYMTKCFNLIK